ncbi:hypothetical protein BGZ93_007760 [Podila epicladia]|nr:hypothetical protein BGZ92_000317 [Podila epicladia]KAG0093706.1 hypothetical protein BGZ93_007760 [Podila epicladia]
MKIAVLFVPGLGPTEMQQDMVHNARDILTTFLAPPTKPISDSSSPAAPTNPCHPSLLAAVRSSFTPSPSSINKVCFRGFSYTNLVDEDQQHLVRDMSLPDSIFTFVPRRLLMTSMRYILDPEMCDQIWTLLACHIAELATEIYANDGNNPQEPVELIPISFSMGTIMMTEFMSAVHAWFEKHRVTFEAAEDRNCHEHVSLPQIQDYPWYQQTAPAPSRQTHSGPRQRKPEITKDILELLGIRGVRLLSTMTMLVTLGSPLNMFYGYYAQTVRIPAHIRWINMIYPTDLLAGPLVTQRPIETILIPKESITVRGLAQDPIGDSLRRVLKRTFVSHVFYLIDPTLWSLLLKVIVGHADKTVRHARGEQPRQMLAGTVKELESQVEDDDATASDVSEDAGSETMDGTTIDNTSSVDEYEDEGCHGKGAESYRNSPSSAAQMRWLIKRDSGVDLEECREATLKLKARTLSTLENVSGILESPMSPLDYPQKLLSTSLRQHQRRFSGAHTSQKQQTEDLFWDNTVMPARIHLPINFDATKPFVVVLYLPGVGDSERYENEAAMFAKGLEYSSRLSRMSCSSRGDTDTEIAGNNDTSVIGVTLNYRKIFEAGQDHVLAQMQAGLAKSLSDRGETYRETSFHHFVRKTLAKDIPTGISFYADPDVRRKYLEGVDAVMDKIGAMIQAMRSANTGHHDVAESSAVPVIMMGMNVGTMVLTEYLAYLQMDQNLDASAPLKIHRHDVQLHLRTLYTLGNHSTWVVNWRNVHLPQLAWTSPKRSISVSDPETANDLSLTAGWFNFHYRHDLFGGGDLCHLPSRSHNRFAQAVRHDFDLHDAAVFQAHMSLGPEGDKARERTPVWGIRSLWDVVGGRWLRTLLGGYSGQYLRDERVWCAVAKAVVEAGNEV